MPPAMPLHRQTQQRPDQGLMTDQQDIALGALGQAVQNRQRIIIGSGPVHGDHSPAQTDTLAYQLGRLLRPQVGTGQYPLQPPTLQMLAHPQGFLATGFGQWALGIGGCPGFSLAMAQNPELHDAGLSSAPGSPCSSSGRGAPAVARAGLPQPRDRPGSALRSGVQ